MYKRQALLTLSAIAVLASALGFRFDLFKFGAAGGQADGSPIMSFKIGKH